MRRRTAARDRRNNVRRKGRHGRGPVPPRVKTLLQKFAAVLLLGSVGILLIAQNSVLKDSNRGGQQLGGGVRYPAGRHQSHNSFRVHTDEAPPCTALQPNDISYTLVTQMSADRIWMLGKHCERWGFDGPISAVAFTDRTLTNVTSDMVSAGCKREQLTVQTLSTDSFDEEDYPVNVLRNMALSAVTTTHVLYVDIDFWPSADLRDILRMDAVKEEFARDPMLAVVVPAFQLYGHSLCDPDEQCEQKKQTHDMPATMETLKSLLATEDVDMFDPSNWNGHGSTSYKSFLIQDDGELFDLPCINSNRYEPYLAFRYCHDLPPFQEQFAGYGKNKLTWVIQMRRLGWDFSQIGGGYVVHYPHEKSRAKTRWDLLPMPLWNMTKAKKKKFEALEKKDYFQGVDWSKTKRGEVDRLYLDFRRWLDDTVPDASRIHKCDDMYNDDNKLWVH